MNEVNEVNGIKQHRLFSMGVLGALGALALVTALIVAVIAQPAGAQSQYPGTGTNSNAAGTPVPGQGYGMMNGQGMMGNAGGMMGGQPGQPGQGCPGGTGGQGQGGGMMGGNPAQPNANGPRLSGEQAREAVSVYLNTYYKDQNLAIAEIMEFQNNFYARINEQATGINAFELLVDPYAGNVWPEYGPNMMWNTKYGHMGTGTGGMMGRGMMAGNMMGGNAQPNQPTADMPVSALQAVQDAQQYLDTQSTGLTAEAQPDTFYGYYTIETVKDGQVLGMLSVNGYTGQVWYHTWHGSFIGTVGE
jgi:hypothetical protein